MLHPSYTDLMNVVNAEAVDNEHPVVNSRYSIVMATSKRARQIVDGAVTPVDGADDMKPLSVAVKELEEGVVKILPEEEEQ